MYFVIQVQSGKEARMQDFIVNSLDPGLIQEAFVPMKRREKKYKGVWHMVDEPCFKGYVFIKTNDPHMVYSQLFRIEEFTKLVGTRIKDDISFVPLTPLEVDMIKSLVGEDNHIIDVSEIKVFKNKIEKIFSGPLLLYKDRIVKADLHHRSVTVEDHFGGERITFQLGIHIKNDSLTLQDLEWDE